ncbi:hypothetical protein CPB84DRAFT_1752095 [Gymnopilus junonius]|uniref:Uncharacterized protein n=1 Tax=Gymnopilus junonius TaxID=109634 RepID=A0A9P5NDT8_GYMJU|nr:hypothetical protein CPB84DRAFT_1752095 [Gymnopilus junonius]
MCFEAWPMHTEIIAGRCGWVVEQGDAFVERASSLVLSGPSVIGGAYLGNNLPPAVELHGYRKVQDAPVEDWPHELLNQWRKKANAFLWSLLVCHEKKVIKNEIYTFFAPPTLLLLWKYWRELKCQEDGVWVYDCIEKEMVLVIIWVLALLGDNPMQSEFACHAGLRAKFFCHICWVKGKDGNDMEEIEKMAGKSETFPVMVDRISHFMKVLKQQEGTMTYMHSSKEMFENVVQLEPQVQNQEIHTQTGMKDTFLQSFIDKIERAQNADQCVQPNMEAKKYFWWDAIEHLTDQEKEILKTHLTCMDLSGLDPAILLLCGQTLVQHAGFLVRHDFKILEQVAIFALYDLLDPAIINTWGALSALVPLIWQPEIDNLEMYLKQLESVIHHFLDCATIWTPRWFNKPKFHLLVCHLVSGGYYPVRKEKEDGSENIEWMTAGTSVISLGSQASVISQQLGLSHQELPASGVVTLGKANEKAMFRKCTNVVVKNNDRIGLDDFVIASISVPNNLMLQASRPLSLLQIAWIQEILFSSSDKNVHLAIFYASLDLNEYILYNCGIYHCQQSLLCSVNVQHNCASNKCNLSSSHPVYLEQEMLSEPYDQHSDYQPHQFRGHQAPNDYHNPTQTPAIGSTNIINGTGSFYGNVHLNNFNYSDQENVVPANALYTPQSPEENQTYSLPNTDVEPQSVTLELATAIADQYNLDSGRCMIYFSFHWACRKFSAAEAMVSLLHFALDLQTSQVNEEILSIVKCFGLQLESLSATTKKNFSVTDDIRAHIRAIAHEVVLEKDRTVFKDMYQDVMLQSSPSSSELGLANALDNTSHKAKVCTAAKNISNEVREALRHMICASVMEAGPTKMALAVFAAYILEKFGLQVKNMDGFFVGQMAMMRAYALDQSDKKDIITPSYLFESDLEGTPLPAASTS